MVMEKTTNMMFLGLGAVLVVLIVAGSTIFYEEPMIEVQETREMMDTYVTITVYADEETANNAIEKAFERMDEIINISSTWEETAEAYILNLNGEITNPSEELIDIIQRSIYYYDITNESFDITVQPLLDLWTYKPGAEKQFWELEYENQTKEIEKVMPLIGCDKIDVNLSTPSISLEKDGMEITLGGIAKGYAVDEAIEVLKDMGIEHALINAGGDLTTIGINPESSHWTIALQDPENESNYITRFKISGKSIATSGNYERYYNESAKVGHILNPKTGFSSNECWSVSIITDNCTHADALATGVFVIGPEKGMELIESLKMWKD